MPHVNKDTDGRIKKKLTGRSALDMQKLCVRKTTTEKAFTVHQYRCMKIVFPKPWVVYESRFFEWKSLKTK